MMISHTVIFSLQIIILNCTVSCHVISYCSLVVKIHSFATPFFVFCATSFYSTVLRSGSILLC